jgi:hypothetical protein
MKTLARCTVLALTFATAVAATTTMHAQMSGMSMPADGKKMPSPPASTEVSLAGKTIKINYNAPSLRGRHLGGPEIVPYGQEWRTGANPATTLITPVDLIIGDLKVPAGTYTLFTLPSADTWQFIVSTKTGEWGIPYPKGSDLGRTPMMKKTLPASQEVMSISFEHTEGKKTQLHVKWETTDVYVPVVAQ